MKQIVRNNCTSCHTPSYTLQHRFDENGWNAIIQTMKNINVYGAYRPGAPVNPVLDHHQKELAAYLAKVRGPAQGGFKITSASASERRGRPRGLQGIRRAAQSGPGASGEGSPDRRQRLDAWARRRASARCRMTPPPINDGNLWFAAVVPNKTMSVGKIDAKTGKVTPFRVDAPNGNAAVFARPDPRSRTARSGSTPTSRAAASPRSIRRPARSRPTSRRPACRRSTAR